MSYRIIVRGTAKTEHPNLEELNGISYSESFTTYLSDEAIKQKGISGGYMHFEFSKQDGKLYTITEYECEKELAAAELERLKEYTQGQWSDGIGEGFEQNPCKYINGEKVYISPWHWGQEITITQEQIN